MKATIIILLSIIIIGCETQSIIDPPSILTPDKDKDNYLCIRVKPELISHSYLDEYVNQGSYFFEIDKAVIGYRISQLNEKGKEIRHYYAESESQLNYYIDLINGKDSDSSSIQYKKAIEISNKYNNIYYCDSE